MMFSNKKSVYQKEVTCKILIGTKALFLAAISHRPLISNAKFETNRNTVFECCQYNVHGIHNWQKSIHLTVSNCTLMGYAFV